jgi:predicted sulfurtransferase
VNRSPRYRHLPRSFNNLYTLEGGIQNYMRQEGLDHWNGSLFVFDGRMAIRPSESGL